MATNQRTNTPRQRPARHRRPTPRNDQPSAPLSVIVSSLAIVFVVCVGVGLGIFFALGGPSKLIPKTPATHTHSVAHKTPNAAPGQDEQAQATPEQSQDPSQDVRDVEFAVDPERVDWNFGPTADRRVYLTFDDGPSENTEQVLNILDAYGIKATFFVTGINPDYFDKISEAYRRGHTIGLHTYSHEYSQVYASIDAYWDDLSRIGEVVRQQIGYVPCFIRFPGGSSNTISAEYTTHIMSDLAAQVQERGYQYFDWDASCGDGADHTAEELVEATIADTSAGLTDIVFLMHDGAGKQTTVEALPAIIEHFRNQGYGFYPIDRTTPVPHHGIGN